MKANPRFNQEEVTGARAALGFKDPLVPEGVSIRRSSPQDPKHYFRAHPTPQRKDSGRKSIKMGAQGFPDTDYAPTLMDEQSNAYKMDMNLFPELQSDYDMCINSEHPTNEKRASGQKSKSFYPGQPIGSTKVRGFDPVIDDFAHGLTIESILDPNFADEKSSYCLTLRIMYQTSLGESLCVVGDIEELGQWKQFTCQMKWTEGHVWVLENLLVKSKPFFNYKYVLLKDDKPHIWERGENRIADLRVLPDMNSQDAALMNNINIFQDANHAEVKDSKKVEIVDHWEQFTVKFSIYFPIEQNPAESMHICGSVDQLGSEKNTVQMLRASSSPDQQKWLLSKYGREVTPWECTIRVNSSEKKFLKYPAAITYQYFIVNEKNGQREVEKINPRRLEIQKPETYKGQISKEG